MEVYGRVNEFATALLISCEESLLHNKKQRGPEADLNLYRAQFESKGI
jgi:hypothetical protein